MPVPDLSDLLAEAPALAPALPAEAIEAASELRLMWAEYICQCGEHYQGPAYHHTPLLAKHRHLRKIFTRMYPSGAVIYTPVEVREAFPDLPRTIESHRININACPACVHGPSVPAEKGTFLHESVESQEVDNFWVSSLLP